MKEAQIGSRDRLQEAQDTIVQLREAQRMMGKEKKENTARCEE
jgi:hypothetical protein